MAINLDKPCRKCGCVYGELVWQSFANSYRHIRIECERCGGWCGYAPMTPENKAAAVEHEERGQLSLFAHNDGTYAARRGD